jgi:putative tryptophan/tyrosine transport system substrate-binding protein
VKVRAVILVRIVVALLTVSFLVAPAEAQQTGKVYVIGILSSAASSVSAAPYVQALKDGLRELGWIEGQNIAVEERYSAGKLEPLPELAADLVRLKVDTIIAAGQTATRAAMAATKAIPIVMAPAGDAVATGLIASFARPGGNVTGISILTPELTTKGLELLKEAVPKATRIAVLFNPDSAFNKVVLEAVHARAQELGTVCNPRRYALRTVSEPRSPPSGTPMLFWSCSIRLHSFTQSESWTWPMSIGCRRCTE